jgi:hypothetical protein
MEVGEGMWDIPSRLYPPRWDAISPAVPSSIRWPFEEARQCYECKTYTASAVLCRRTLEEVCVERSAPGRTLVSQLEALKQAGEIDQRLLDWAQALRLGGNQAAHAGGPKVEREDARDTLDFTEAILDYVYVYRARFAGASDLSGV